MATVHVVSLGHVSLQNAASGNVAIQAHWLSQRKLFFKTITKREPCCRRKTALKFWSTRHATR